MRYSPEIYAKSFFEVLEISKASAYESILKRFLAVVSKNGDQSRINAIIEAFERLVVKSNGGKIVEIITARDVSPAEQSKLKKLFSTNDLIKTSIDPKLVAGVRVELNGELELDYSLAKRFRKMFG